MSIESIQFNFLVQRGRFKEAEQLLRGALAKNPGDADLHMQLSRVLCKMDRPKEAQDAARRAIGLEPDWSLPHEILAEALLASSNLNEAEQAVKRAIAAGGDDPDCRAILARIYQEKNRSEISLEHANAGLALDPDHDTCRFFRTIALGNLGRHSEADQSALQLLSDDPEDSANHSARGWILLERNATAEARMHFQEALRLDPDSDDARMGLARCLQQGNPLVGWFLRLIIRMGRIPAPMAILLAVVFLIIVPNFLKGKDQPELMKLAGVAIRTALMTFLYLMMVARPLFDGVLYLSRTGRAALGPHEMRAVRWCCLPLLTGFLYLGGWILGGGKSVPFAGIGWLATAVFAYEGFSNRHPWVRRRMIGIAGVACGAALWFSAGPQILLKPLVLQITSELKLAGGKAEAKKSLKQVATHLQHLMRVRNRAFIYPALLFFLMAAYSDEISEALKRRAPDDSE